MTNAEAIRILRNAAWFIAPYLESDTSRERVEKAVGMAIKALEPQEAKNSTESSSTQKALDTISRQAAIDALHTWFRDGFDEDRWWNSTHVLAALEGLPSAQPEWNNHTVACMLAELFNDTCACNYNGIDEWLPEKCEVIDACPNPVGVACWEQYLKHRAERRTDEAD